MGPGTPLTDINQNNIILTQLQKSSILINNDESVVLFSSFF